MKERSPRPPGHVRWVCRTLEEAGYPTWAVGGALRNTLLGLPAGDWDMATRAPPGVVRKLFPRTVPIGVEHGTVGVLTRDRVLVEVTTFRRDVETTGRHAVVEFAESIQEDLARRDFTINAVAWHPIRQEFLDPYQGRADLERGVLRTVGEPRERFAEDYLRVLRGLRFSGRFRLRVEDATWNALCAATRFLPRLSPERIREELLKILNQDARPSGALALYAASGALGVLFPELAAVQGRPRAGPGRAGLEEDLWVHSLLLTDLLSSRRPMLRLAALLQGVGEASGAGADDGERQGETWEMGPDAVPGTGAETAGAALMIRYKCSNAEVQAVTELLAMGLEPPLGLQGPPELRRWLFRAGPGTLRSFARIWLAKARLDHLRWGMDPEPVLALIRALRRELAKDPPLRMEALSVNGRDLIALGMKPGPRFGEILRELMDRVVADPSLNERERLLDLVASRYIDREDES